MWELDYKEGWMLKNWCLQIVLLDKTLESPLDRKEINLKGDQLWIYIGRNEAKAPIPDLKSWYIGKDPDAGKDWRQEEKGTTEDEMVEWHHRLSWHRFEPTPGESEGQGSLICYSLWSRKESDATEQQGFTQNPHTETDWRASEIWWPTGSALDWGLPEMQNFGFWNREGLQVQNFTVKLEKSKTN